MKKVLVTGGSGFIGTAAVDYCLKNKIKVANLDVKEPNVVEHQKYYTQVDIRDFDLLKKTIQKFKPTHILHLAAKTGMDIKSIDVLNANTDGVQNLIDICRKLPSLKGVVFTSSLLVCENGYIPNGDTDYCPPNLYGESKMIGEQLVRDAEHKYGWAIVRPTSIWGPWFEHSYKQFFQMIDKGLYFHLGKTQIVKPISYVGNTVHMMFNILFEPKTKMKGKTFYLADYPGHSTRQWAEMIRKNMAAKKIKTLPLAMIRMAALLGTAVEKVGVNFPITNFRLNNMLTGGEYPTQNTRELVGDLPYDLEAAVNETIVWMHSEGLIQHKLASA